MLQRIISKDPSLASRPRGRLGRSPPDIRTIIVSPTRELAEQIAVEARRLTVHTGVKVQTAVGGTGKREGMRRIMTEGCHVLVATPGRLNDILSDEYSPIPVNNLDYLIFDEADRLLEAGFWEEIKSIRKQLPDPAVRDRQTLMFSATVPKEVVKLVRETLRPGFHFVKTVRDDEEPTHQRVPQKSVICAGLETQMPALLELCQREAEIAASGEKRPFKSIVYLNSLKEVQLAYDLFREIRRNQRRNHALWQGDLLFIHSGLGQGARQRMADTFRAAERAVLFSTDVTARGMDFPNVTHVMQMGIPRDPADYVHRIGRTGRAGKEGEGWLIVPEFVERDIRYKLGNLPIQPDNSLQTAKADLDYVSELPEQAASIITTVQDAFKEVDPETIGECYPAIVGVYAGTRDKRTLMASLETMAKKLWGLQTLPRLSSKVASMVGQARSGGDRGSRGGAPFARSGQDFQRNDRFGSGRPSDRSGGRFGSDRQTDRPGGGFGSKFGSDRQTDRSGGGFGSRFGSDRPSGRTGGGFSSERKPDRFGGGFGSRPERTERGTSPFQRGGSYETVKKERRSGGMRQSSW